VIDVRVNVLLLILLLLISPVITMVNSHITVSADVQSQIAYGANLNQMRPPIYNFAFALDASAPAKYGVSWLREAAFVDQRYGSNLTQLYNMYTSFGYNWEFRFDVQGVTQLYGANWNLQQWDNYVTYSLNAFPDVHVWEVGNEVLSGQAQYNNGYLASGNLTLAYFNMLKDTYNIVKQHDALDTVIAFGGNDFFDPAQQLFTILAASLMHPTRMQRRYGHMVQLTIVMQFHFMHMQTTRVTPGCLTKQPHTTA
jgi:hypothetical protein